MDLILTDIHSAKNASMIFPVTLSHLEMIHFSLKRKLMISLLFKKKELMGLGVKMWFLILQTN